eukprot:TRINITY_DN9431_c4_g1_i1.p1 TRINITY_DN9431_c4_g1~~TRINITY_DN9431_c4_g1_i1.p1  ORF type:complete len:127 (+),score=32.35 TRINITY_DN9431_c4_g1_i1:75-455(+)
MSAPQQVAMGAATGGVVVVGTSNAASKHLGQRSSDFKGCWKQCGGVVLTYFLPCGDTCICGLMCVFCLFPASQCYFQKTNNKAEWKEPCNGDGNSTVLYMVDDKTIKTKNEGMCGTCDCCDFTRVC